MEFFFSFIRGKTAGRMNFVLEKIFVYEATTVLVMEYVLTY